MAHYSISVFLVFVCMAIVIAAEPPTSPNINGSVGVYKAGPVDKEDVELLEFALNLEYLEAEFFLNGVYGHGLDSVDGDLGHGGPRPKGAMKADMENGTVKDMLTDFAFQEVGHLRAIKSTVPGFPRPLLDLSKSFLSKVFDTAMGSPLSPPFDAYNSTLNFLLASYLLPYVGLTGYVGSSLNLKSPNAKRLVAGLLAVEAGQDAQIRAVLYDMRGMKVEPYEMNVGEFTEKISKMRNKLGGTEDVDEGVTVAHGREMVGKTLSGDSHSVAFGRTPEQILKIVYSSGNASVPGGFFPHGAFGLVARSFLS